MKQSDKKIERYDTPLGRYLKSKGMTFRQFCKQFKFRLNTIYDINNGSIPYRNTAAKIYAATNGQVTFQDLGRK